MVTPQAGKTSDLGWQATDRAEAMVAEGGQSSRRRNCQSSKLLQLNNAQSFKKAWMDIRGNREPPNPILLSPKNQGFSLTFKSMLKT